MLKLDLCVFYGDVEHGELVILFGCQGSPRLASLIADDLPLVAQKIQAL